MGDYQVEPDEFKINEVVELKGFLFKVVLIDAFCGKLALKQIAPAEAGELRQEQERMEKDA